MTSPALVESDPAAAAAPDDDWHWAAEIGACAADPAYFLDQYGIIDKPKAPGLADEPLPDEDGEADGGKVAFRLWPSQVPVMGTLASERLVLILKARQLGISWLVCGYVLWLALYHANQAIFLYSKGQAEASEMLRRVKALFTRLPAALRDRLPAIAKGLDNTRTLGFDNGSVIRSMPATKNAGISYTASLVVLDEWARMPHGGHLFEMVKPIMEAGGQMILLSTANGLGNWFHDLWDKAIKRLNSFRTVFLPWTARPGRDAAWYAAVLRDATDPDKVKENYPGNPIEAFRSSGRTRFRAEWIEAQAGNLRDPLPAHLWPGPLRGVPGLRVYAPPVPGVRYLIASDVSEGRETSNYDGAVVLRQDTWEEVALLHGQWEPDTLAVWLIALGTAYGTLPVGGDGPSDPANVVVERNNHGHAALATLKFKGYPRHRIACGHDGYPGWLTNARTKDPGVDLVAAALRDQLATVRSQAALNEFAVYKRLKNGATGAEPGYFDDIVMMWVIGLSWLRQQESAPKRQDPVVGGPTSRPAGFPALPTTPGFPGPRLSSGQGF